MDLGEEIRKTVGEKLSPDQFIVDVVVSAKKGPMKISVILDGDQGISIDDCAEISRYLSGWLDGQDIASNNYLLEVSSPGVDHPLRSQRQFAKNVGRKLRVTTSGGIVEGRLAEATAEGIVLEQETGKAKNKEIKRVELKLDQIEKAFVQISFK